MKGPGTIGMGRHRWLAVVLCVSCCATAQSQSPPPKVMTWNNSTSEMLRHYGILGEIRNPGVYSSEQETTLQTLVNAAGGLSQLSSPSVRIVRGERGGQTLFYAPDGRDVLQPGDFVVIDTLRPPHQPGAPAPSAQPAGVWIGLLGVSSRPVVVQLQPDRAQLPTIIQALRQSPQLARAARVLLPPRSRVANGPQDLLPSGTIIAIPSALLVANNLPDFPPARPLATAPPVPSGSPFVSETPRMESTAADFAPPPMTAGPMVPLPPVTYPPASSVPPTEFVPQTSLFDRELTASTVPFTSQPTVETPANRASLPAPGSRFAIPAPAPAGRTVVAPPPPTNVLLSPEDSRLLDESDADLVGEPGELTAQPTATFNLWQLLGIGGTVASLVGIAVGTRQYLDRRTHALDSVAEFSLREDFSRQRRSTGARQSPPAAAEPPVPPPPPAPIPLSALLANSVVIDSEAADFPKQMSLQGTAQLEETEWRLDRAHAPIMNSPHLELPAVSDPAPILELDEPASQAAPRPHFRPVALRESLRETVHASVHASVPEMSLASAAAPMTAAAAELRAPHNDIGKTPLERALAQLQRGRHA